jgi:hypothetical protein
MWSDKERLSGGGGGGVVGRATSGFAAVSALGDIGFAAGGGLRFGTADGIGEDGRLTVGQGSSGDLGLLTRR